MRRRKPRRVSLDVRGLSGREDLFLLSGAIRTNAEVRRWFAEGRTELRLIAQQWFERIRACGGAVREVVHDGCPTACVEDAAFAYVNAFKRHVNVGFFHGASLDDPAGLLEGSGKRMRHVKLVPGREVNHAALDALIDAAYADIKTRLRAQRS
jgi:hypothetical protein